MAVEVSDDDFVLRRIPNSAIHESQFVPGGRRVSSGAFSASSESVDPEKGMSVDLLSILNSAGIDPANSVNYAETCEVVMKVKVSELRKLGLEVVSRPKPGNPAHCNVLNVKSSLRKSILEAAEWVRRPNDVDKK